MTDNELISSISGDIKVAGTPSIAARGALYAVDLSTPMAKKPEPELLPPRGRETALRRGPLTKTEEEETIIINRPDRSTYPRQKSVLRSGATPVLMARSSKTTAVRDIMKTPVMYVLPDQTSEECMALMTEHRLRHFPVVDNGKLIGLISIGDLVKDVVSEQKFTIQELRHYITGDRG
jgi:CBS domain-containing protein